MVGDVEARVGYRTGIGGLRRPIRTETATTLKHQTLDIRK